MLGGVYRSKCNTMGRRRAERNHCKWTGSKIMWNHFSPFLLPLLHLLCNFPLRLMRKAVRITVSILFPYWGPTRKNGGGAFDPAHLSFCHLNTFWEFSFCTQHASKNKGKGNDCVPMRKLAKLHQILYWQITILFLRNHGMQSFHNQKW